MELLVTTPTQIAVKVDKVRHVRAEDASGSFGIEPGHADFLTVLTISVVHWRNPEGREHFVAVRGGLLRMRDGERVEIATREAVVGDDLDQLRREVITAMIENRRAEQAARSGAVRLEQAAIRQIYRYLRPTEQLHRGKPATTDGTQQ